MLRRLALVVSVSVKSYADPTLTLHTHTGYLADDADQVRDGLDHAANGLIVDALDDLVEAREAETFNYQLVLDGGRDRGTIILDADLPVIRFLSFGHD